MCITIDDNSEVTMMTLQNGGFWRENGDWDQTMGQNPRTKSGSKFL